MTTETSIQTVEPTNADIGSTDEPVCGWHDAGLYSVSYIDIEVLIDRQSDGEVEIRVWRNSKEENYPYAKMTFAVNTFVCGHCTRNDTPSAECDACEFCVNCCTHGDSEEIDDPKGEVTLPQVYESLEAAIDAVCDQDTQNAIADEYRRQIKLRYDADKEKDAEAEAKADTWISQAKEVYEGIELEITGGEKWEPEA